MMKNKNVTSSNTWRWCKILSHDGYHMNTPAYLTRLLWKKVFSGNDHHYSKLEVIFSESNNSPNSWSIPSREEAKFPVKSGRTIRTLTQPWPHFTAERALISKGTETKSVSSLHDHAANSSQSCPPTGTASHLSHCDHQPAIVLQQECSWVHITQTLRLSAMETQSVDAAKTGWRCCAVVGGLNTATIPL